MANRLPDGWVERNISDIATTSSGGTPNRSIKDYWGGDIPWLKSGELKDSVIKGCEEYITESGLKNSSAKIFRKNSLLLALYGATAGKLGLLGFDSTTNQAVCCIDPNEQILDRFFLFYYLLCKRPQIIKDSFGGAQPNISQNYIREIIIPLPPLPEQHRIVAKLDRLFKRIDKAIDLVEQNITNVQHLMASVLNDVFNEGVKDFQQVPLMKYVEFVGGSQPAKQYFSSEKKEGYVRLIQIRDYKSNDYTVYIKSNSTKKFCDETNVMIGRYGPPVFQILRGINGAYNVALMKAIPDEKYISKDFLFWFLQNPNIQSYIIGISQRSAGQSGVNKSALEKYSIPLPPLAMQMKISDTITQIFKRQFVLIKKQTERLNTLKEMKSSLLDAAFKGEL